MPQRGIGQAYQLPNYIAQVLLDHNVAVHNALGLDHSQLINHITCLCSAYLFANQNHPTATITKVLFDRETLDVGGNFDADGADSDFTAPADGDYRVYFQFANIDLVANTIQRIYIYKEGVEWSERRTGCGMDVTLPGINISDIVPLLAGEKMTFHAYHSQIGNSQIRNTREFTFVNISRVGQ